MKKDNQRKLSKIIIMPDFQWRFVGYLVITTSILSVVYYLFIRMFLSTNYDMLIELSSMTDDSKLAYQHEYQMLWRSFIYVGIMFVLISGVIGVIFSHRIAGPISKISSILRAYANGDKTVRLHLRPNDEFKFLENELNTILEEKK